VIGVVTPAFADEYELAPNGGGVGGPGFRDGGLEDEGTWREEFPDGGSNALAFTFGLAGVLEA
jgi:hypothetical protein